jgi:uncharacterized protein YndB with AHSA1/START domain
MGNSAATVGVARTMDAPAEKVWSMISDITRMGEWSPEATGGSWLKGATGPAVGAKFRGTNRKGIRWWWTTCTVTEADPAKAFAFKVDFGPLSVAEWSYRFEPTTDGGCTVTETWRDRRLPAASTVTNLFLGVKDRAVHNKANMEKTLDRLATAAEA